MKYVVQTLDVINVINTEIVPQEVNDAKRARVRNFIGGIGPSLQFILLSIIP